MGCVPSSRHHEEVAEKEAAIETVKADLAARKRQIEVDELAAQETERQKEVEIEQSKLLKRKAESEWDTMRTLLRNCIKVKKAREQTLIQQVVMTLRYKEVTVCFREWRDWMRYRRREKFTNEYRQKVEDLTDHNKIMRTQRDFALKKSVLLSNDSLQSKAKSFVAQMGFRSRSVWFDMWKQFVRDTIWDRRNAWSLEARQNIERLESEIDRMQEQLQYCKVRDSDMNNQIGTLHDAHSHRESMAKVVGEGLLIARHVSERQLAQFPRTAKQNDLHLHRDDLDNILSGVSGDATDAVADWLGMADSSRTSPQLSNATLRNKGYLDNIGRTSRRLDKFDEPPPPSKHQWADMATKRRESYSIDALGFAARKSERQTADRCGGLLPPSGATASKADELRLPQLPKGSIHPVLQDDSAEDDPLILRTPRVLKPSLPVGRMKPVGSMTRGGGGGGGVRKLVASQRMVSTG